MAYPALAVADYIVKHQASKGMTVTPMQLLKLVYICHGWSLGAYKRPLINESVEAWRYGPVIPSVYQAIRRFRSSPVTGVPDAPAASFTEDERKLMDWVCQHYGIHSGIRLSQMTHHPSTPWAWTWANRDGMWNPDIPNDLIQEFYTKQNERASAANAAPD